MSTIIIMTKGSKRMGPHDATCNMACGREIFSRNKGRPNRANKYACKLYLIQSK